jgi:pimeloyl-ACP methyl ester carboxylesterase
MTKILAGDLDTHVQRLGPTDSDAPVVVFIHGLLTDSLASYYFTLGPAFAAAGVDVVMYDLRGHGKSGRPPTGYRLEQFVSDLDSLLDALGITRPVHLVGNSFGGSIAYGLATARPDRVATVIAIEAEPPVAAWAGRMAVGLDDARSQLARSAVIDWIAAKHGAHTARLSKAAGRLLQVTSMAEDIPVSGTISDDLVDIRCPVLAIFGADSGLADQVPHLESHLTSCRTVVLPDQGHSVLIERTDETREAILTWVREHHAVGVR